MSGVEDEPVSYVFLSCDLTGSTNYKQRQDLVDPWQKVFLQFYREFPQRIAITQVALGTQGLEFELWKPIGDELIYSCAVRSEEDVYNAVRTWVQAMKDYEKHSLDDTDMGTKGGAFIATFPGPDSRSSVPRYPGSEDSDADLIELNREAQKAQKHDVYVYDYFGPSIDTGFRVIGKCTPRYFTLSVEVALAVLGRGMTPGRDRELTDTTDIILLDFVELKGVWKNRRYPVIAIDTEHDNPVHQAYSKFEHRGTTEDLHDLCEACYRSDDWPSKLYLPDSGNSYYRQVPADPLADYPSTSSDGAEAVPDEPDNPRELIEEDLDLGVPSKGVITEGFVSGDDRIHGFVPDGTILCEAVGDDMSGPWTPTAYSPFDDDPRDFNPSHERACPVCADIWYELPD
ncbi:hypothetical protein [Mycolicibacterium phlei]